MVRSVLYVYDTGNLLYNDAGIRLMSTVCMKQQYACGLYAPSRF